VQASDAQAILLIKRVVMDESTVWYSFCEVRWKCGSGFCRMRAGG